MDLREMIWAAEAAQRERWDGTASILSMLANVNRDPKKARKAYTMEDFHPLRSKAKPKEDPWWLHRRLLREKGILTDELREAMERGET